MERLAVNHLQLAVGEETADGRGQTGDGGNKTGRVEKAKPLRRSAGALAFKLPPELEAGEPSEARGLARDAVRLMVSYRGDNRVDHTRFNRLSDFLAEGDLLVINTSGTLNAALPATRADGRVLELHLSTPVPDERGQYLNGTAALSYGAHTSPALWVVELREPGPAGTKPFLVASAGERLALPGGGEVTLLAPYARGNGATNEFVTTIGEWEAEGRQLTNEFVTTRDGQVVTNSFVTPVRLWLATLRVPSELLAYLARYGSPIRYGYVKEAWPASYYQTVYTTEPGSAEMPSAGRAFTPELITRLVAQGVQIVPLILHTGVASLEAHEPPYAEYYRVPAATARLVNSTHAAGRRVIAVGTTVVRALETVTDTAGVTHPGEGWTRLIITPQRGVRAVDGLLTGLHEPEATHLAMLEALAGLPHLQVTYAEALHERYLWHEFGDLHLLLP